MEEKKSNDKRIKKAGIAALSVSVLTAGTVGLVSAYQSGTDYKPADTDRDIQKNQVVFNDNEDTVGHKKNRSKDESELLKKDQDTGKGANKESDSNYLFEKGNMLMPDGVTTVGVSDDNLTGTAGLSDGNTVYRLTDDPTNANLLLNGGSTGAGKNGLASNDNSNNGSGNENGGSNGNGQGSNGQNGNHNGSSDNNNGQNNTPQNPTRPADKVKDPESQKTTPADNYYEYRPFKDGITPSDKGTEENPSVVIMQSMQVDASMLYKGQSVDERLIYNALETYVHGSDGKVYIWGADALGTYIRIDGVSFDDGATWTNTFPVTIPSDAESMKLKVSYRLSVNDTEWTEVIVSYLPQENRIFVLSRQLTDDDEQIDSDIILNSENQYLENGMVINLFREQEKFLSDEPLTELFPGWTEDGVLVPWLYTASGGRHILEPADMVPLDSKYVVKLQLAWMSDDYKVGDEYANLTYLQTLTDIDSPVTVSWTDEDWYSAWLYEKITVPEYIQAVMIDESAEISVNYLELPDSVLYVKTDDSGMRVNEGYIVSPDNINYDATDDGMLMNKEDTEILSIPYEKEEITIPATVRKVDTETKNKISRIYLEAGSEEEIPDINYNEVSDCTVQMKDDLLEAFLVNNQEAFTKKTGNCAAAEENPDVTYVVQKGTITDDRGNVRKILNNGNTSVRLADDMESVEAGAFEGADSVQTLVMPKDGGTVRLDEGCFSGSQLRAVRCYTQEQYDSVMAQIGTSGAAEDITVELLQESQEGYWYAVDSVSRMTETVLVSAPANAKEFDGTVTAEDGSTVRISAIGDDAFEDCKDLVWALLPEDISTIGYRAFENCTSLEGVLIGNTDSVIIGDEAWSGCGALRFIASNAMNCTLENGYDPCVTDKYGSSGTQKYFYAPTNSEGYGSYSVSFVEESDINSYTVLDLGEGGKMLYGVSSEGNPWIALRSGTGVPDNIEFPSQIKEIYRYALADTHSPSGSYTVNFRDTDIWAIDTGAFYNSDLGGDIVLNDNSWLLDYAMTHCGNITSMTMPGENIMLSQGALSECKELKTVKVGKFREGMELCSGLFAGCDSLTDVTLEDETPAEPFIYNNSGVKFQFNPDWTPEEEVEKLRVHVPAGTEKAYAKKWRYAYAGYTKINDTPAYMNLWNDVYYDNIDWDTGEVPDDEVVDQQVEERVLEAENLVRREIGTQTVSEPTEYYPYHLVNNELVMLAGAPSDTTELDLNDTTLLDLPEGWYLDGIEKGAFKKCTSLQRVVIPANMTEIASGAFEGVQSGTLTLEFEDGGSPAALTCEDGTPFSFGVDESNVYLHVPEEREDEFMVSWAYPLAGYTDLDAMRAAVKEELQASDPDVTDASVDAEIANRLLPVENRLRAMMHMDPVEELDAGKYGLNITGEEDPDVPDADESDTENPDTEDDQTDASDEEMKDSDIPDTGDADQTDSGENQDTTDQPDVENPDIESPDIEGADTPASENDTKSTAASGITEEAAETDRPVLDLSDLKPKKYEQTVTEQRRAQGGERNE